MVPLMKPLLYPFAEHRSRQVNQMTMEAYAERAHQWAKAIKLLDPSVCLILCGETGHSSWDHYVLKHAIEHIDMHSELLL